MDKEMRVLLRQAIDAVVRAREGAPSVLFCENCGADRDAKVLHCQNCWARYPSRYSVCRCGTRMRTQSVRCRRCYYEWVKANAA
jgi:predicted amidophosphoribosyltransferase